MIQKPFLYVTNPETFIIYKYQYQDGKYQKFEPHIPQEFELMNVRQQQQYRQWKALKFMMWSIFNKDKIQNPIDFRIILCRLMDLNTNVFLAIASTIGLRYFLMKLQSPFMDYYFEDRLIQENCDEFLIINESSVQNYFDCNISKTQKRLSLFLLWFCIVFWSQKCNQLGTYI